MVVDPCAVQDHVPVWIGGRTLRSLRRVMTLAEGWAPFAVNLEQVRHWLSRFEIPPGFEVVLRLRHCWTRSVSRAGPADRRALADSGRAADIRRPLRSMTKWEAWP